MPELPEVGFTRLGLHSHIVDKKITGITIRQSKLRWPVPDDMQYFLKDRLITNTQRRGKYLLFETSETNKQPIGWLIIHLGMSGTLRLIDTDEPASVHDHIDLHLVDAIRQTLQTAIHKGGSSLRDFVASDGRQGYFQFDYMVYGQTHKPCRVCKAPIQCYVAGQRSTFFCPRCQRG